MVVVSRIGKWGATKVEWKLNEMSDCFQEMKISMKFRREGTVVVWFPQELPPPPTYQLIQNVGIIYLRISWFIVFQLLFCSISAIQGEKNIQTMHLIPLCEWFRRKKTIGIKYEEKNGRTHRTQTPIPSQWLLNILIPNHGMSSYSLRKEGIG